MNKVIMIGRLTADPKKGTTQNGIAYARFSVAVVRRGTDANGNRITDFFNCVAWRGIADFIGNYFTRGNRIAIEGSLENREYTAQDGSQRRESQINVYNAEFCESRHTGEKQAKNDTQEDYQEDDDPDLPF